MSDASFAKGLAKRASQVFAFLMVSITNHYFYSLANQDPGMVQ